MASFYDFIWINLMMWLGSFIAYFVLWSKKRCFNTLHESGLCFNEEHKKLDKISELKHTPDELVQLDIEEEIAKQEDEVK